MSRARRLLRYAWGYHFGVEPRYVALRAMNQLCRGRPVKTARKIGRFEYELVRLALERLVKRWADDARWRWRYGGRP